MSRRSASVTNLAAPDTELAFAHVVLSNSDHWKSDAFAGCAPVARCAKPPCNHLKNHNRPWPHIAAFYPAIVFQCCPSFPTARARPRCRIQKCEMVRLSSSRLLIAVLNAEDVIGVRLI
jgi:hypothetical protein